MFLQGKRDSRQVSSPPVYKHHTAILPLIEGLWVCFIGYVFHLQSWSWSHLQRRSSSSLGFKFCLWENDLSCRIMDQFTPWCDFICGFILQKERADGAHMCMILWAEHPKSSKQCSRGSPHACFALIYFFRLGQLTTVCYIRGSRQIESLDFWQTYSECQSMCKPSWRAWLCDSVWLWNLQCLLPQDLQGRAPSSPKNWSFSLPFSHRLQLIGTSIRTWEHSHRL